MKILLLLSTNASYRFAVEMGNPYSSYAPTTLVQLAALVPDDIEAEVEIIDLIRQPMPKKIDADILGISTITCGAVEAYRIADEAREQGVTVVLGGSHPTVMPEEAAAHADAVVVGYAERSWPELLRDYKNNKLRKFYRDFSNPFGMDVPFIDRRLQLDKNYYFNNTMEITKGCPNSCGFCTISSLNCEGTFSRDTDSVMAEIETMGKHVLFLDSNHTEFGEYNIKLWQELKKRGIKWYCAASTRFASNEKMVKMARECGCKGVLVGFESVNQESLAGLNKTFNKVSHYYEMVSRLHDNGLNILGCFIFGFDHDNPGIFEETLEFVNKAKIEIVKYAIATPFPGTPFFNRLEDEGRLLHKNWELYDTEHAVFTPAGMTVRELEEGLRFVYRETYSVKSMFKRLFRWGVSPIIWGANFQYRNIAYTYDRGR